MDTHPHVPFLLWISLTFSWKWNSFLSPWLLLMSVTLCFGNLDMAPDMVNLTVLSRAHKAWDSFVYWLSTSSSKRHGCSHASDPHFLYKEFKLSWRSGRETKNSNSWVGSEQLQRKWRFPVRVARPMKWVTEKACGLHFPQNARCNRQLPTVARTDFKEAWGWSGSWLYTTGPLAWDHLIYLPGWLWIPAFKSKISHA